MSALGPDTGRLCKVDNFVRVVLLVKDAERNALMPAIPAKLTHGSLAGDDVATGEQCVEF